MKMSKELSVIRNYNDLANVAEAMAKSGYFEDSKSAAQAIVKIMAGQELGLGPFASMAGINVIKGKPALGANMIATLIKNDPRYDYKVKQLNDDICELTFFEDGIQLGVSTFTKANLEQTEGGKMTAPGTTKSMKARFPRNLLFARAMTNGAKWYTPGIFGGAPVYTPEELGADVDEDGNVVTVDVTVEEPTPEPAQTESAVNGGERSISKKVVDKVVEDGLADNYHNAVAMLKLSALTGKEPIETTLSWCRAYRNARTDGEMEPQDAAGVADSEVLNVTD